MSIYKHIKMSLLSFAFFSKLSFAVTINGQEVFFSEDSDFVIKSYESLSADAWVFRMQADNITLSAVSLENMQELIEQNKIHFDKIDSGEVMSSYNHPKIAFSAENFSFDKTLVIAKKELSFTARNKINIMNSIMDVGELSILTALQMNFNNLTFRTKNRVVLENALGEDVDHWFKAIEIFSHDIENISFIQLDGAIDFAEPSIPEQFMVIGAHKIAIIIKKPIDHS